MQLFCTLFASFCLEWLGYYNWGLPSSGKKTLGGNFKIAFLPSLYRRDAFVSSRKIGTKTLFMLTRPFVEWALLVNPSVL